MNCVSASSASNSVWKLPTEKFALRVTVDEWIAPPVDGELTIHASFVKLGAICNVQPVANTYADLGIEKNQAHRWQVIASKNLLAC